MNLHRSDEPSRRQFLAACAKSFLGVTMLPLLTPRLATAAVGPRIGRAKSVIYLYMSGGMSHLDTFDMKPGTKEAGPTEALRTTVDGMFVSEYLPRLARCADKVSLVNALTSNTGAHEQGNYLNHTSYAMRGTIRHPSLGAWIMRLQDRFNSSLPASVVIGDSSRHPGAGFMEAKYQPVMLGNPQAGLANSRRAGSATVSDFDFRRQLSETLDAPFRQAYDVKDVRAYTSMYKDAVSLMSSSDLAAFDITKEPEALRKSYGEAAFGQGCLLARRLVEHGVRFVEVTLGGWDTHNANFVKVPENCETLDKALSSLLTDLAQRGLLEETLVVVATEFGRTPDINMNDGRDHYPKVFSGLLAGGGVKGGYVHGSSERGREVASHGVTVPDFNATIATALGLPLKEITYSPSKRPFTVADKGEPVLDLFA